jgi:hypothetical protein
MTAYALQILRTFSCTALKLIKSENYSKFEKILSHYDIEVARKPYKRVPVWVGSSENVQRSSVVRCCFLGVWWLGSPASLAVDDVSFFVYKLYIKCHFLSCRHGD